MLYAIAIQTQNDAKSTALGFIWQEVFYIQAVHEKIHGIIRFFVTSGIQFSGLGKYLLFRPFIRPK